jgi:hypothetical protein
VRLEGNIARSQRIRSRITITIQTRNTPRHVRPLRRPRPMRNELTSQLNPAKSPNKKRRLMPPIGLTHPFVSFIACTNHLT